MSKPSDAQSDIIIIDNSFSTSVPFSCEICNILLRDMDEILNYSEKRCCTECWTTFVEVNRNLYGDQWKPTEEQKNKYIRKSPCDYDT